VLSVTIETSIFAPPHVGVSAENVRGFVTTLLDWKEALDEERLTVYKSKFAVELLMQCEMYPIRPQLKMLLTSAEVFEYDSNTVAVLAEALLARSSNIEDAIGIYDVLVDELAMDPDVFEAYAPVALRDDAKRCAVVVSLAKRFAGGHALEGHAIAIRAQDLARLIQIRGLIRDIEHTRDDLAGLPLAPEYFEASVLLCGSCHLLLMNLNVGEILRGAMQADDVQAAIRVGLYKRHTEQRTPLKWQDLPAFTMGSAFFASLQAHHVTANSGLADRLMRSMVETICHDNLAATHALRSGAGGGNRQRMRGKDSAWRRDVDYEYHLHYWECEAGNVELANLVVHDEFSISE